jgi:recombinational DNA repair protein (RecF pathway)
MQITLSGILLQGTTNFKGDVLLKFLSQNGELIPVLLKKSFFKLHSSFFIESTILSISIDTKYSIPVVVDVDLEKSFYQQFLQRDLTNYLFFILEVFLLVAKEGLENQHLYTILLQVLNTKVNIKFTLCYLLINILVKQGLAEEKLFDYYDIFLVNPVGADLDSSLFINFKDALQIDFMVKSLIDLFEERFELKLKTKTILNIDL